MNWKLRLKNPATCGALIVAAISFIYEILAILGVTPGIGEGEILNVIAALFTLIFGVGIAVDPTTKGIGDSDLVMTYTEPSEATDEKVLVMTMPNDADEIHTEDELPSQEKEVQE